MENIIHSFSNQRQAKIRLFCFHYAGGGPSAFRDWHEFLPCWVDVQCINLPGRELRFNEPLTTNIDQVLEELERGIEKFGEMPFVFFGHSLGGLLSHQLSMHLKEIGKQQPEHLIVSGRSAPKDKKTYYDRIVHLSDVQFLQKLPEYGGTPKILLENRELMELYIPILKADFSLSESRIEKSIVIDRPISAFSGNDDRLTLEDLELWKLETQGPFETHMFNGDHFYINQQKVELLEKISRILSVVERDTLLVPSL